MATLTKYAWAIPLKNKNDIPITNAFKTELGGQWNGFKSSVPNKLGVGRGSEFYNKFFPSLIKQS